MTKEHTIPEGLDFLQLIWHQEDDCEVETDNALKQAGRKAPASLRQIGTVLSFADRMASCWWECRGGDHVIEYICGRVTSNARAALRLLRFGFYDESLLLCRSLGETSNLLQLFFEEAATLQAWKESSKKERMENFRPVKVRCRLEELQTSPVIDQERYSLLCEQAAHVQPDILPQAHNILGLPLVGATFQEEGAIVCLNEIALPLATAVLFGAAIMDLDVKIKSDIFSATESLVEQLGGATITRIDDYRRGVLEDPSARNAIDIATNLLRRLQSAKKNNQIDFQANNRAILKNPINHG